MQMKFRMPNINAPSLPGQIQQIHSFLRQLVTDLQIAFTSREGEGYRAFMVAPCNNGISVKRQSCRVYDGLGLVHGQAVLTVNTAVMAGNAWAPVLRIPTAYAPKTTVAVSAVMPGVGVCNGYIQGKDTQAPGMVYLSSTGNKAAGTAHEAMVTFVYQKEE